MSLSQLSNTSNSIYKRAEAAASTTRPNSERRLVFVTAEIHADPQIGPRYSPLDVSPVNRKRIQDAVQEREAKMVRNAQQVLTGLLAQELSKTAGCPIVSPSAFAFDAIHLQENEAIFSALAHPERAASELIAEFGLTEESGPPLIGPKYAPLAVHQGLKADVDNQLRAARVTRGANNLHLALNDRLPGLPEELLHSVVSGQSPEAILAYMKNPNKAIAELLSSLGIKEV
jgi:hypothetical protein